MALFRKRIKIAKGINLNLSKSGISTTVGGKYASVNVGKKGAYLNTKIPGTGLHNRQKIGGNRNSHDESSEIVFYKEKSTGIAYLLFFILWAHYAYLNKWGLQILFWITAGGFGLWWLIDLFTIPSKVREYNGY